MIENISLTKVIYSFLTIYTLSLGGQFWSSYKMSKVEERIQDQIQGKLDTQARALQTYIKEQIGLAKAKMVDIDELEKRTNKALGTLSEDTQSKIKEYQRKTNAQVSSLSVRMRRVDAHLTEGFADVGQKVSKKTPPPKEWKGVKAQDVAWCKENPKKCDRFPIKWRYPTRENPVTIFSSENIWGDQFKLKFDFKFRITTVGFRDKKGVVENQAMFIDVGYTDEKTKKFKALQSITIKEGDNEETDVFFHTAAVKPGMFRNTLGWFDPSVLLGASFVPTFSSSSSVDFRTGLTVGGALINLRGGEIRLGANGVVSSEVLGVGAFGSYHTKLFGRTFNLAPIIGVLFDQNLQSTLQVGLVYQLY